MALTKYLFKQWDYSIENAQAKQNRILLVWHLFFKLLFKDELKSLMVSLTISLNLLALID